MKELDNPYLQQHLKPYKVREQYQPLCRKIGDVTYENRGIVTTSDGSITISIDYEDTRPQEPGTRLHNEYRWIVLKDLEIKTDTGDGIKLSSLFSTVPDINFTPFPDARQKLENSHAKYEKNSITLYMDPVYYTGLVVLFHELGHLAHFDRLSDEDKAAHLQASKTFRYGDQDSNDAKTLETILRSERSAWAYALHWMKPVLTSKSSPFKYQTVSSLTHKFLDTYCNTIRYTIKER